MTRRCVKRWPDPEQVPSAAKLLQRCGFMPSHHQMTELTLCLYSDDMVTRPALR